MTSRAEVKAARSDDVGAIASLEHIVFGVAGYPAPTVRQLYDIGGPLLQVARVAGEIVGHGIGVPSVQPHEGWILSVAVRADVRRRGIGKDLTRSVVAQCEASGIRVVRLTVDPHNVAAMALYRSLGFVEEELVAGYFGAGKDRMVMRFDTADLRVAQSPATK